MRKVIILLFAALALQAQSPTGNAENGGKLFNTKYRCYSCHGWDGHGGSGARLVPMKLPEAAFVAYVRSPKQMPSYSAKMVSDAELTDIYAYIKTLPLSPDAKDIPLLSSILNNTK